MLRAPDPEAHYGIRMSLAELSAHNHGAAEVLLSRPRQVPPPPLPPLPVAGPVPRASKCVHSANCNAVQYPLKVGR